MTFSLSNLINFLNLRAPKGLIRSAKDWIDQQQLDMAQMRGPQPRAFWKKVFEQEENIHLMNGSWEKTGFEEFHNVRWTLTEEARIFYLEKCRILGDEGAVISPDNKVFGEFTFPPSTCWADHSCFKRRCIPPVERLPGWYATIVYPESKFFFHWMIESLPRMALLSEYMPLLDGVFIPSPVQKFHRESLEALGLDQNKLIPVDVNSHYQPERLFVPRTFSMYNPPRWMHRWFKEKYISGGGCNGSERSPKRRIYISREDAPARRVVNEMEVVACLEKHGFDVVTLTGHTFLEQAKLFNDADIIVAAHGAGLSNTVFCKKGTKIIEILPPRWMAPCFMVLASSAECDYKHIVGGESVTSGKREPQRDNIIVPIDILEQSLSGLC